MHLEYYWCQYWLHEELRTECNFVIQLHTFSHSEPSNQCVMPQQSLYFCYPKGPLWVLCSKVSADTLSVTVGVFGQLLYCSVNKTNVWIWIQYVRQSVHIFHNTVKWKDKGNLVQIQAGQYSKMEIFDILGVGHLITWSKIFWECKTSFCIVLPGVDSIFLFKPFELCIVVYYKVVFSQELYCSFINLWH